MIKQKEQNIKQKYVSSAFNDIENILKTGKNVNGV